MFACCAQIDAVFEHRAKFQRLVCRDALRVSKVSDRRLLDILFTESSRLPEEQAPFRQRCHRGILFRLDQVYRIREMSRARDGNAVRSVRVFPREIMCRGFPFCSCRKDQMVRNQMVRASGFGFHRHFQAGATFRDDSSEGHHRTCS